MRDGDWNTVKNDGGGQMIVAFTVTEINYSMVSLFWDLVRPFYICDVKFFGCAICLVSAMATKAAMASSKSFTIF